jgi:hypothetical protein
LKFQTDVIWKEASKESERLLAHHQILKLADMFKTCIKMPLLLQIIHSKKRRLVGTP